MREIGISLASMALTVVVLGNAYYTKKQFYPSVVYITKSNPSMAVIYFQSMVFVLMMGKLMKKIFLGTLRATEFEHLMERFWYALTETCLAFTVFRDDFNPKFIALFTVLLFLKSFHWLAEDRVDYMERSPVIGWLFHARAIGLVALLSLMDYMMISHAYYSTMTKGPSVQLVFGFEYAILLTLVINTSIKYVLHAMELRLDSPWENKAVFLLYTELIIGFVRVILYVLFVIIMVRLYTLPLFAFRPMYYAVRNFKTALNDVVLSRRAIQNMNTLYPDATPEELQLSDNICIICREDMVSNSKKLPCGHIFHTICLRSWFQRQQTCPTCRLNILRTPVTANSQPVNAAAAAAAAAAAQRGGEGVQGAANVQGGTVPAAGNNGDNATVIAGGNAPIPGLPMNNMTMPQGMPIPTLFNFPMPGLPPPFMIPPPPIPPGLDRLSEEELRLLEGTERRNVEERIKFLRNVQTLLDASSALMTQYQAISVQYPIPIPPPVVNPVATSSTTEGAAVEKEKEPTKSNLEKSSLEAPNENVLKEEEQPQASKMETVTIRDVIEDEETVVDGKNSTAAAAGNEPRSPPSPNDEFAEMRRRRLERFSNPNPGSSSTN